MNPFVLSRPACLSCLVVWGKDSPAVRRMQKNHVTTLTVIAGVVDIDRFGSPEKLVSYAGIAPAQGGSGEAIKTCRITKQGSMWLRNATAEAANSAIPHGAPAFYGTRAARLCQAREWSAGPRRSRRRRGSRSTSASRGCGVPEERTLRGGAKAVCGERPQRCRRARGTAPAPGAAGPMRAGRSWRP